MMNGKMKIAHITERTDGVIIQDLKEHLEHVAALCSGYMKPLGCPAMGYVAGIIHDAGKGSMAFQSRMEAIRSGQPDPGQKGGHASGGADGYLNRMHCEEKELQEIETYFWDEIISRDKMSELLEQAYTEAAALFQRKKSIQKIWKKGLFTDWRA